MSLNCEGRVLKILQKLSYLLTEHFVVWIVSVFALGLMVPTLPSMIGPFVLPILACVMLLAFLKIDLSSLGAEIGRWPYYIYLLSLVLVIVPSVLFFAVKPFIEWIGLDSKVALGVLLLFACPSSVGSTTFSLVLGGRFERSILVLVLSSFLAPVTLPALMYALGGQEVSFDPVRMGMTLACLMFVPFVVAMILRKSLPNAVSSISPHTPALSIFLLLGVELGAMAGLEKYTGQPVLLAKIFTIAVLTLILAFVISWNLERQKTKPDRMTTSLVVTLSNLGLAVGLGNTFFHKEALIVVFLVVMVLPWHLTLLVAKLVGRVGREA